MSGLFTPADIFRAKALGCEPEQLLPADRTCEDCREYNGCLFVLDDPPHRSNRHCLFMPSKFSDKWRIRIDQAHEKSA